MTIADILEFQSLSGEYGQWVKRNNPKGQFATPVGKYQFVGTRLRKLVNGMGLPTTTVFTPEVQDKIFNYSIKSILDSASTVEGKRKALRSEWDGFHNASNSELDAVIKEYSA
jgi:muramidase (phage lysozyme)